MPLAGFEPTIPVFKRAKTLSSSGLFKHVVNRVEEVNDKDKLVGQTYDGACVMSGHINGLQSKVIEA
jgi:hypothetical protein